MDIEKLKEDFIAACNYPGTLDEEQVTVSLKKYLNSLGIKRKIVRLKKGWNVSDHPSLLAIVNLILNKIRAAQAARAAPAAQAAQAAQADRDALAARDARDAQAAQAARDALAARDARD